MPEQHEAPPPITNTHTHVFTIDHFPEGFLPAPLMWLLRRSTFRTPLSALARLLAFLLPGLSVEQVGRYEQFLRLMLSQKKRGRGGQAGLLDTLSEFYPPDTRFVLLSMDMVRMGAGDPRTDFEAQLSELASIKKDSRWKDRVFPFVAVDPRRTNHLDLVKRHIEEHSFTGVKLYPPLGYWPSDARLMKDGGLYDYCARSRVPIITHASPPGAVRFRGAPDKEASTHPGTGKTITADPKLHAKMLTNPDEYRPVLEKYRDLRICFAHFGGGEEWEDYLSRPWRDPADEDSKGVEGNWVHKIRNLVTPAFPNVYTDISYTWASPRFTPLLKLLLTDNHMRKRLLFGTDFYMVELEVSEREASIEFRYALGEEDYGQIAQHNPREFLQR